MNVNIRPYIVINGKSSRYISGLLITELPPISKPKQRTKTETIDGRDGDIITRLGYSAYDKTLKIALTYDYNIDDIIELFDSEGVIVFSNEPDKYYRYAIYEQIDFDRLLRYKTGEIDIHVQPFKYSEVETEVVRSFSGNNKSFDIRNNGNIYSRPTLKIVGSGEIDLLINDTKILTLRLATNQTIIIDSESMNATSADGETLLNRLVTGDYDKIRLKTGVNKISFTGSISSIAINHYSRWI